MDHHRKAFIMLFLKQDNNMELSQGSIIFSQFESPMGKITIGLSALGWNDFKNTAGSNVR